MSVLRLKWNGWFSSIGTGLVLQVFEVLDGSGWYWEISVNGIRCRHGANPPSELAAKFAAEAAAFEWLRQGIEAFGARVIETAVAPLDLLKEIERSPTCGWPSSYGPCPYCRLGDSH
jgi:hypothetical protein